MLLAVLLPAVLLAPFHHHEDAAQSEIRCDACLEHQPHQEHFNTQSGAEVCLICQLLGQPFVPSDCVAVCFAAAQSQTESAFVPAEVPSSFFTLSSPRAPPVSF